MAAYDGVPIPRVEESIKQIVNSRHTLSPDDTKAVMIWNMSEQVEMANSLFRGLKILTWIVGLGTLLAVGISNIMLVTVRERTQEIGVRRALGAKPRTIISQIMSEAFVLTFVAGVFGLALAVGLLSAAETLLSPGMPVPLRAQIPFSTGMLSLAVLVAGGLVAGILPANRAMQIKPVDAIREE